MHDATGVNAIFIIVSVLLFMALGVAILVIIDHKAKLPEAFHQDPFSIAGMRRDHPVIGFLTAIVLGAVILSLLLELAVTLGEHFGVFPLREERPVILERLQESRAAERLRHFHNVPEVDLPNLGKKAVCFYCHGDYPHSKERMVRTLLNMHTQFVGCMTCHVDARKVPEEKLSFGWLNYSGIVVKGQPFGTQIDPKTGFLLPTDNYYSRIVAFIQKDGKDVPLEISEDRPDAQEFLAIRDKLSERDREAVKKTFHKIVSPKGRFCSRCHTDEDDGYLPFMRLGFSEERVAELRNLNLIGIVQRYRKFYMPKLLGAKKSLPKAEILVGEDKQPVDADIDIVDDPRSWWRETFDQPETEKSEAGKK